MKKVFCILLCSGMLAQVGATTRKPLSVSPSVSSAYGTISVEQAAKMIKKNTTEKEV